MTPARLALLALAATLPPSGIEAEPRVAGYVKTWAVVTEPVSQLQGGLRLMAEDTHERISWQVHYELLPVASSRPVPTSPLLPVDRGWRLSDPAFQLGGDDKHTLIQNLDRLNVRYAFDGGDLTVGRQAVTFGMARVINPTDVFLPYNVTALDTEYRVGIDAVRYQRPFGPLGEIDFGVVAGDGADAATSGAFLQLRTNVSGHDLQFSAVRFANQDLIGAGVQTAAGELGFWLEGAAVSGDEDYFRLSAGLDRAFGEDVYGLVEYHFNGAGSGDPLDYPGLLSTSGYRNGGVFLMGRHYLIPALNVQLSPLLSLGTQALWNLSDDSVFASARATVSAGQNLYIDLGIYGFSGGQDSEYGGLPETAFASLRYYF